MSGDLKARLEAAVAAAVEPFRGQTYVGVMADQMVAAFVAGLGVLAETHGLVPRDAAPPVRELPTEPGAVVLASMVRGVRYAPPVQLLRAEGAAGSVSWCGLVDGRSHLLWLPDEAIDDWQEATVVPTAVHEATVKALRDVVELLNGPQSGDVQEAQDAAIGALAGIEGWAGL